MIFTVELPVRFAHVDAAGILFYPRYFEMLNASLEALFADHVGVDFATLHLGRRLGVPTVSLQAEFRKPSRLGDRLSFDILVERLGNSSCGLRHRISCGDEIRAEIASVIVCMDLDRAAAVDWPDDIRSGLSRASAG